MSTTARRFLAALSACGIGVALVAYAESLSGTTLDDMLQWMIALGIGAVVIQIPMFVLEYPSLKDRTFFWKGFARGMPGWVVAFVKIFWLIVLAHFVWLFIQSDRAVPIIRDGQFILSSRGRVVKVLTQSEYLTLRAADLRVFAVLMIACYLAPLMYWWFPRNERG